jgi:hypothetical protein
VLDFLPDNSGFTRISELTLSVARAVCFAPTGQDAPRACLMISRIKTLLVPRLLSVVLRTGIFRLERGSLGSENVVCLTPTCTNP